MLNNIQWIEDRICIALRANESQRPFLFVVEWLFHGIPWIGGSILLAVFAISGRWPIEEQDWIVLLNIGLVLDLIFCGVVKVCVQRPRPLHNRDDFRYGAPIADRFSFPSGHTTRAAMLARFLERTVEMTPLWNNGMWLLVGIVALSRISMGRHHPSDVLAGVVIGILEAELTLQIPPRLRRTDTWVRTMTRNLVLLFFLIGLCPHQTAAWGYEEDDGPSNWDGKCREGQNQSPIDIRAADVEYAPLHRLHFVHYDNRGLITLANNGHTISGSGFNTWEAKQPYVMSGGLKHKYKLEQFHLHWADSDDRGSEHTIGGLHYPAELHLVHHREDLSFAEAVNTPGGLAVVAVFVTIGEETRPLESVVGSMKEVIHSGNRSDIHGFHTRRMLPGHIESFYRYDGSLTTPGCFETVVWTILSDPVSITRRQMDELRRIRSQEGDPYKYNYRPVQRLNGRKILYRPSQFDKAIFCGNSAATSTVLTSVLLYLVSRYF
ncbi:unnamed protein product, partial [Mesorhabditis spiculigera]